jgi:hypothetical protein
MAKAFDRNSPITEAGGVELLFKISRVGGFMSLTDGQAHALSNAHTLTPCKPNSD